MAEHFSKSRSLEDVLPKVTMFTSLDAEARSDPTGHCRLRVFHPLSDGRPFTLEHLGPRDVLAAAAMVEILSGRTGRAHARSTDLAIRNVHERLAMMLLRFSGNRQHLGEESADLVGATEWGGSIGAARETVLHAWHDLARQAAVTLEHARVQVVDPAKRQPRMQAVPKPE